MVLCCDAVGSLLVTGSKDHTMRVWDSEDGTCLGWGEGHVAAVSAAGLQCSLNVH
jgi:WD40 repeat protein